MDPEPVGAAVTGPDVKPQDPWRGFTLFETHQVVDPEAIRAATYKGSITRFADVGHPVETVLEMLGIAALIIGIVVGLPLPVGTVVLVVVIGVAAWNHGHAVAWAEQHNARVEAVQRQVEAEGRGEAARAAPSSRARRHGRRQR
jgi:hypothetical protein